jgi:5-methylcytosine-specific restriction endonuclease McrA
MPTNLPPDGDSYISKGEIKKFDIRPCGTRHSLRLICKACKQARLSASNNRSRNPIIPHLREWIIDRDGNKCMECHTMDDLTVDHIVPVILGGKTNPDNLQTLCRVCNSRKGSR